MKLFLVPCFLLLSSFFVTVMCQNDCGNEKGCVYVLFEADGLDKSHATGFFKVGGTSRKGKVRRSELQNGNPRLLVHDEDFAALDCKSAESAAHDAISKFHYRGEWFNIQPEIETQKGYDKNYKLFRNLIRKAVEESNKQTRLAKKNPFLELPVCS